MRFNLGSFFQTASAVAQGEIEGGLEAEQLRQQRMQQLAARQMQQLQFAAGQQEQAASRREHAAAAKLPYSSLVDPSQQGRFLTNRFGEMDAAANTPGIGADVFNNFGTPQWTPPSLNVPPTRPVAGTGQAPAPPGGGAPVPGPATPRFMGPVPTTAGTTPPTAEATAAPVPPGPTTVATASGPAPGAVAPQAPPMAGMGPPIPPGMGGTMGPAVPQGMGQQMATPEQMNMLNQIIGNRQMTPGTTAIFQGMMGQQAVQQQPRQIAQTVAGATGGAGSPGPPATATPGPAPSVGIMSSPGVPPPGGVPIAPVSQPIVNPNGMSYGNPPPGAAPAGAPPVEERPMLKLPGEEPYLLQDFNAQDVATSWSNFQGLLKQLPQMNLQGPDQTEAQSIVSRNLKRPRNKEDLERFENDYSKLVEITSGKSLQQRAQDRTLHAQWTDNLMKIHGGAGYLVDLDKGFNPAWGANPLAKNSDYLKMKAKLEAGDQAGADRLAEQVQLGLKGGLSPEDQNRRMGMLFQAMSKIAPGSLSGHELLHLAQRYMPGAFTEEDAPMMQRYLFGAAAEKQQDMLLGQFKNWESIPPGERDNIIARINGLGKVLGQDPIKVDAKWERKLTPQQRMQLAQGQARIELQGEAVDIQRASLEWRNYFQEHPGPGKAGKGQKGPDQELRKLVADENQARENAKAAMRPKDAQPGVLEYLKWRADPKNKNPDGSIKQPTGTAGIEGSDVPLQLWYLEEAQKAASNAVIDYIHQKSQAPATAAPSGGAARKPGAVAKPGAVTKPISQMTGAEAVRELAKEVGRGK